VIQYDVGGFSTQFQRYAFDIVCRGFAYRYPGSGRTGKGDHVDTRVRGNGGADLLTQSIHQVEYAFGVTRLVNHFCK